MASTIYTGASSQTTAFSASDIYTLAVATSSITNISQSGANVVIQTGATSFTITGVTLAELATSNFALQGGGTVIFGDGASGSINDQFGNTPTGTANADILMGLGGGDTIVGNEGANLIFGGSALTDTTDGNDNISSGSGNDTIYGNGGNDTISSGGGADFVFGGIGTDTITTGSLTGTASVYGGGSFIDTVDGADSITIAGSSGSLFVTGNAGNDTISVTSSGSGSVYGGIGADDITVTATAGNYVIAGGSSAGTTDVDTITFNGSGAASATIYGGISTTDTTDGVDNITATFGAGSTGVIYGNAGNDVISLTTSAAATVYGGVGNDAITITQNLAASNAVVFAGPNDAATETVTLMGVLGAHTTVYGGTGINDSADGSDMIVGGSSDDLIYGNGGNDTIMSGQGTNTLFGGAGNDLFIANDDTAAVAPATATSTTIADFGAGADTVLVSSILASSFNAANASSTTVQFTGTQDTLNVTGTLPGVFTAAIDSGATTNVVDATDGVLSAATTTAGTNLVGGGNSDVLFGNSGNDMISAGAGDDRVFGNGGQDRIDLGTGTDTVAFGSAFSAGNTSADTITGFNPGGDKYDIGFSVLNGATNIAGGFGATNTLAATPVVAVVNDTAATADGVIFTFASTNPGDVMAANSTVANAVANAVTALTSGTDFSSANIATGDSLVLVLGDGTNSFVFHYVADGTPAVTTAADLELIGVVNGVNPQAFMTGDFI